MVYIDTRFRPDILQIDFAVVSTSPTKTKVKWALLAQPDTETPFPAVKYNLYFNVVPNRHMTLLNSTPLTETIFSHATAKYVKTPRGYYQIEATDADGNSLKSSVWDIYAPFDRESAKMSKEALYDGMHFRNDRIDNIPAVIYARKGFGNEKCPNCTVKGIGPLKSKCPICLGTGKLGGYHAPVLTFLGYETMFAKNRSEQGNRRAEEIGNTLTNVVEVCMMDVDDYFRELLPPHRLFCVTGITQAEYGGRPIKQFLSVQVEESYHPLWELDPPTVVIPKQIFYRSCRETYETIVDSFNQESESSFGGFPQVISPQLAREADGTIIYRGYPSGV